MRAKDPARPDRSKKMRGEGQGKRLRFQTEGVCQSWGLPENKSCFYCESSVLCRQARGLFPNESNIQQHASFPQSLKGRKLPVKLQRYPQQTTHELLPLPVIRYYASVTHTNSDIYKNLSSARVIRKLVLEKRNPLLGRHCTETEAHSD